MTRFFKLILLFFVACGVKQPIDNITQIDYGSIVVHSSPVGASILLNGTLTYKITPDTLHDVPVGPHTIKVIKNGYHTSPESLNVSVTNGTLTTAVFTLQAIESRGYIYIQTIPEHAAIVIDDQPTSQFTPDTISTNTGNHTVTILKNGYQSYHQEIEVNQDSVLQIQTDLAINQRVLLETFGNVSCTPCVQAATNLHTFVENHDKSQYAIIEYFANWPNPNDPFYKESPQDVSQRLQYYALTTLPSSYADGSVGVDALDYAAIVNTFQDVYHTQSLPIGICIEKFFLDGHLNVHIDIYSVSAENLQDDQLRLYAAIIENNIHYNSPPGSNGLTDFDFVFRAFLSTNTGDPLNCNSNSCQHDYTLNWEDWDYSNCQVVAFIQNKATKQIIQTSIN